jgi:hypothetical protein
VMYECTLQKGIESQDNIFLRANKIKLVIFVHAQMVFKFKLTLLKRKINIKFFLASVKTLINSTDCSESRINWELIF